MFDLTTSPIENMISLKEKSITAQGFALGNKIMKNVFPEREL